MSLLLTARSAYRSNFVAARINTPARTALRHGLPRADRTAKSAAPHPKFRRAGERAPGIPCEGMGNQPEPLLDATSMAAERQFRTSAGRAGTGGIGDRSYGRLASDLRSRRVRLLMHPLLEPVMLKAPPWPAQAAIRTDLGAIFVSIELSRRTWLITSLSPGAGEKMSKHSVPASDVSGLLHRFAELRRKAAARTGRDFPIIVNRPGFPGGRFV